MVSRSKSSRYSAAPGVDLSDESGTFCFKLFVAFLLLNSFLSEASSCLLNLLQIDALRIGKVLEEASKFRRANLNLGTMRGSFENLKQFFRRVLKNNLIIKLADDRLISRFSATLRKEAKRMVKVDRFFGGIAEKDANNDVKFTPAVLGHLIRHFWDASHGRREGIVQDKLYMVNEMGDLYVI